MDRTNNWRRTALICALLGAATLASFWPVLNHQFISYDDQDYVTANAHVQKGLNWQNLTWAFTTYHAGNWHPLTWLSHMGDVQFFGLNPGVHHAVNLFLHTVNTLILFLLLRRMTGVIWRSAMVAGLFALHPMHVQSVAWVSERKDVLSTCFGLLAIWAYVRYVEQKRIASGEHPGAGTPGSQVKSRTPGAWYGLALLLFILGLMSKPMLVTWPFVLLLLDFWPLERMRISRLPRLIAEKVPFAALSLISSAITFHAHKASGAVANLEDLPAGDRVGNALVAYVRYLGKMLWPTDLAFFYPRAHWQAWQIAAAAALLTLLTAAAIVLARRFPFLLTGWCWFLGTLVPVIGLVQVGEQSIADRYSYIAFIGLFVIIVWGLSELARLHEHAAKALPIAAVLSLATCATLTNAQARFWRDSETLFGHAVAVNPNNSVARYSLGLALGEKGDYELALGQFQAALAEDPGYAEASYSMAVAFTALGKREAAVDRYRATLRLNPNHALAHHNLAAMLWVLGQPEAALAEYAEALRLSPDFPEGHYNMGVALLERGKVEEATAHFSEAVRQKPGYLQALNGLSRALAMQGKFDEAQQYLRQVVRLNPTSAEAEVNLGTALMEAGHTNDASASFARASRLDPDLAAKSVQAAKVLAARGELDSAKIYLTTALRLERDNADAHENMGLAYARQGKLEQAAEQFEETVRLRPDAQAYYNLGLVRVMQHQSREAIPNYQQAIKLNPDWPLPLNDLAWLLATHPSVELRNGPEAVRLAERACQLSGGKEVRFLGTLDAAYAEAGRFADATITAEKTQQKALAAQEKEVAQAAEQRLILYRQHRPFHQ